MSNHGGSPPGQVPPRGDEIVPVKKMTTKALYSEFKELAKKLQPLNSRRQVIWREITSRTKTVKAETRLVTLTNDEKEALYEELKIDLGK